MPHSVAVAVADGAHAFEFSIACDVFGIARPELRPEWYALRVCTPPGGAQLAGGLRLESEHGFDALSDADTLVIPHGAVAGQPDPVIVEAAAAAHERGARLISFCSGAFTVAATGLLDGLRATTHWMYADAFRRRFPRVRLDANVLFVDEGRILTSAGTAAGIDLALHVVRSDFGADVARGVARRMVVAPHRDGGQAQFILPEHRPRVAPDELGALLDWLTANVHREITVADMARRSAMSERTFARRFKESTGTTPLRWLLAQRLHRAQELLETTNLDIDRVADVSGFGTAANLRDHFRRELDTTPSTYRRSFRGNGATGSTDNRVSSAASERRRLPDARHMRHCL